MGIFEKTLHDALDAAVTEEKVGTRLIARQLAKQNIVLTEEQLETVKNRLTNSNSKGDELEIDISDLLPDGHNQEDLLIDLDDPEEIERYSKELVEKLDDTIPKLIEETIQSLTERLKQNAPKMLERTRQERKDFEHRLVYKWGNSFDLLDTLLVICLEAGGIFNEECRPQAAKEQNFVFDVLTRLHARACQVTQEIAVLLRSGFADGAHARWRTLHEITVVAMFIADKGDETAERYLLHDHIESYKAAKKIRSHHLRLGVADVSDEELARLKATHDELATRFGREYKSQYGWAGAVLSNPEPRFCNIEEAISFEHLRPYYQLASHNVHANPKGLTFKLGLIHSGPIIMLAGSSDEGLADPGFSTAVSIAQLTVTVLTLNADLDRTISAKVIWDFAERCRDSFIESHRKLEEKDWS